MKHYLCVAALLILAGCAHNEQPALIPDPGPVIKKQLDLLHGKPVSAAIARLGYPTNEGNVAGEKFYTWSTSVTTYLPSVATTTGYGMAGGEPFSYKQTTAGGGQTLNGVCTIRIFVNKNEIITHTDWSGNWGGCTQYARTLDQAASSQAHEKANAAITKCKNKRLSGELKTYVQSAECSNPRIIEIYKDAGDPYMDIIELYCAKRMEIARKQDANEITEEQAKAMLDEFSVQMGEMIREREKGN